MSFLREGSFISFPYLQSLAQDLTHNSILFKEGRERGKDFKEGSGKTKEVSEERHERGCETFVFHYEVT